MPCPPTPPHADIDATGIHFLDDFVDELQEDGVKLVLGNPSQQVGARRRRTRAAQRRRCQRAHR